MLKKTWFISILSLAHAAVAAGQQDNRHLTGTGERPNVILILADDMGYGDLSCYGQQRFQTPNIDRLANEGMRFIQHYAGCPVCAPSRSSLMTGQDTGHTPIRGNKKAGEGKEGQEPLPAEAVTLGEVMKSAGYVTGAFGKWGLGYPGSEGDPNHQGFDEFFGFNSQGLAHSYYPNHLWHNQEKVVLHENLQDELVTYAPSLIHEEAVKFIEQNRDTSFFLYYPSIIPHAELVAPPAYMAEFSGQFLPETPFKGVGPGDASFKNGGYAGQQEPHAAFAAMITVLDRQVGELVAKIKALGLEDRTLIIFSSDNGPHKEAGADPVYFNSSGSLRGIKRDVYEGGIRVPMILNWPGKIQPGQVSDHASAFWDILPTVAELAGADAPSTIQGISILPTLLGKPGQVQHDYLYWEFHERGGRQAIRQGDWKYVVYQVLDPDKRHAELFNLAKDPFERDDVSEHHPDIVRRLETLMAGARVPTATFPFVEHLD